MKNPVWLLKWILKAAIFFTLFAFALNNQHEVVAHFFFGNEWRAPLVVVVLLAFTAGLVVGVLGMLPRWWRRRQEVSRAKPSIHTGGDGSQPVSSRHDTGVHNGMA